MSDAPVDVARAMESMMQGAETAQTAVARFAYAANSYRKVLSPEGRKDIGIEVTEYQDTAEGGEGKREGGNSDLKVVVYSLKEFARTGKKTALRVYFPEMPVRWANVHTVGAIYKKENEDVYARKRRVILQTMFQEAYDAIINGRMHRLAENLRAYEDINEEMHWLVEQLLALDSMICKAILMFEVSGEKGKTLRTTLRTDARNELSRRRNIPAHEVSVADPEIPDIMVELFKKQESKAAPIRVDARLSKPDTCTAGPNCMGENCTCPGHVIGQKQYLIRLQDRIFEQKIYDKNVKIAPLPASAVFDEWKLAHPEHKELYNTETFRESVDALVLEAALRNQFIQFSPVFYRAITQAGGDTRKMHKDAAAALAKKGTPPAGYHTKPHKKTLKFGSTARMLVRIKGKSVPGVPGGIGMGLEFDSTQILITAQQILSYTLDDGDDVMTYDAEMADLDGGVESTMMMSNLDGGDPNDPNVIVATAGDIPNPDLKRKFDQSASSVAPPPAKHVHFDASAGSNGY